MKIIPHLSKAEIKLLNEIVKNKSINVDDWRDCLICEKLSKMNLIERVYRCYEFDFPQYNQKFKSKI